MKQDDDQLVRCLKDSGQSKFIKTEEKPKWGEFKKRLEIMGGSVVDKGNRRDRRSRADYRKAGHLLGGRVRR